MTSLRMICMPVARFAGTGKGSLLSSKKRIKVSTPNIYMIDKIIFALM